ncbi:thioredoxin family protein [Paenibacillus sp. UNC451MF]|uniref:thioredoxin family protein n=1 Tax=Paenibacillus sp. UNC451MF TaxID=1449063 RepID=UPI00056ACF2F|nr:thioredoxin family protein [Paenibacillus sp. UNC451MF]
MKVNKVVLFTLSACPTGRSMGTVLREVKERVSTIELETVYVDIQIEITNEYRIKTNPTTLFLDHDGKELYRVEGFQETELILGLIEQLNNEEITKGQSYEANAESMETYTVYLYNQDSIEAVEVQHPNKTSVRAPRITAVQVLLQARKEGLENPFPGSAALELVRFNGSFGEITIHMTREDEQQANKEKMRLALVNTLNHFGIDDVKLTVTR